MKVRVQFFSRLLDVAGASLLERELPPGATLGDLLQDLGRDFPRLGDWDSCLLLAVGVEFATRDQPLREGDLVSLMPPVQGG